MAYCASFATAARKPRIASRRVQRATVNPGRRITIHVLVRRRRRDGGTDRASVCGGANSTLHPAHHLRNNHATAVANRPTITRAHASMPRTDYRHRV